MVQTWRKVGANSVMFYSYNAFHNGTNRVNKKSVTEKRELLKKRD